MAVPLGSLTRIRAVHLARLDRAPRVDRRTGELIGAPGALQSLGAYLAKHDAIDTTSEAEEAFGLSAAYYRDLAVEACIYDEGQRFAAVILDDLRAGGNGLTVRCPVAPASGHARYNRKLGPAFDREAA